MSRPADVVIEACSPDPELQPLPTLSSVLSVHPNLIPENFSDAILDAAERMQCPADFVLIPAMVSFGALIGTRLAVKPKQRDDWYRYPILWGMDIGPPSVLKTPAMNEGLFAARAIEANYRDKFSKAEQDFAKLEQVRIAQTNKLKADIAKAIKSGDTTLAEDLARTAADEEFTDLARQRLIVSDCNQEKCGELLRDNPRGLLIARDELSGFLRQLEKPGREGERAFWLELWNGEGAPTTDRIGRGNIDVPRGGVSIIGSIQPGPLADYIRNNQGAGDDGLLQRFQLAVYPDLPLSFENVDRYPNIEARRRMRGIYERFADFNPKAVGAEHDEYRDKHYLSFTPEAQERFSAWHVNHRNTLLQGEHPAELESHFAKYPSLIPSLALLFHLIDDGNGSITDTALIRALAWEKYLASHAQRIYSPVTAPEIAAATQIKKKIISGQLSGEFTARDIYRKGWSGLRDSQVVSRAAELLEGHYWLIAQEYESRGRPTVAYRPNEQIQLKVAA